MSEKMTLLWGRPDDFDSRIEKEKRVYDLLDGLGIEYQRVDHEVAMTMEACEEVDKLLEADICKNLFLCNRQKTDFYLLMIKGDKHFKTKDLSSQINTARLSFAGSEYMESFLDLTPGSVSVFGLMNDKENRVRLLVDRELLSGEYIGCHPCINTSTLKLKTKDIFEKVLPSIGRVATVVDLKEEE